MRTVLIVLAASLFVSISPAQRAAIIQYDDGRGTQYNNLSGGDHLMVLFQPIAPCYIDSISFVVSAVQTGEIELHLWKDEGGEAFPEVYWDLITPVTVTVQAGTNISVTLPVGGLDNLARKPFFAGIVCVDPNVRVLGDAGAAAPTCTSASGGEYYHSFLQIGAQYYLGNGDYLVRAHVRYVDEGVTPFLTDVTSSAGFAAGFAGSKRIAWGDFDRDGFQDVFVGSTRLYKNNGNGSFTDVSASAGIDQGGSAAVFADFDNDGWLDLVVEPGQIVYQNNRNGTFTKHAGAAPNPSKAPTCIAVTDYDGDGKLDYYVGNWENEYYLNKSDYPNSTDQNAQELVLGVGWPAYLYHNNGGFAFTDATASLQGYAQENLGYNAYTNANDQKGYRVVYGAQWCDYNEDGKPDLFVCNYRLQGNFLWKNNGNGTFTEVGEATGLIGHSKPGYPGTYGHTIGCDWGDYDNDGRMDIILSQLAHPRFIAFSDRTALYHNDGPPNYGFTDRRWPYDADTTGINYEETHMDVAWGDYDNDGRLDFGITAVYGCRYASVYHQRSGGGSFEEKTHYAGLHVADGIGVTWADFDNDGRLDLSMSGDDGFHLFRNALPSSGHHLAIRTRGTRSNAQGVGARITAYAGGLKQLREICAGKGTGSAEPDVAYIGLGASTIVDSIVIRWPSGLTDRYLQIPVDTILLAIEGSAQLHGGRDSLMLTTPRIVSTPARSNIADFGYAGDTSIYSGLLWKYRAMATGSAPLQFSLISGPAGINVDAAGTVRWAPQSSDAGDATLLIRVSNPVGSDTQHIPLHVVSGQLPVFDPHTDRTGTRSVPYVDTVSASGVPAVRYAISAAPGTCKVDSVSGIITWTPSLPVNTVLTFIARNPLGSDTLTYHVQVSRNVVNEWVIVPDEQVIEQNFPNPFAALTTIRVHAGDGLDDAIRITDLLGNPVARLMPSRQEKSTNEYSWDASTLPAGVYVVHRTRGGVTVEERAIVVRR
jgi:hypothetical protein